MTAYRDTFQIQPGWLDESREGEAERLLWLAVIQTAVNDAKSNNNLQRTDVSQWLTTKDFIKVCDLADLDPDATRAGFKRILSTSHRPNAQRPEETAEEYADRLKRNVAAKSYYHSRKQEKMLSTELADSTEVFS